MSNADWTKELSVAITVTDENGLILYMNDKEIQSLKKAETLVGSNVFDCHSEPAKTRAKKLYEKRTPSHYTIRKKGQKKIIHQLPWFNRGEFAGYVEISVPIPDNLPHFERG